MFLNIVLVVAILCATSVANQIQMKSPSSPANAIVQTFPVTIAMCATSDCEQRVAMESIKEYDARGIPTKNEFVFDKDGEYQWLSDGAGPWIFPDARNQSSSVEGAVLSSLVEKKLGNINPLALFFHQDTLVPIENLTYFIPKNSLAFTLKLQKWPFVNKESKLTIKINIQSKRQNLTTITDPDQYKITTIQHPPPHTLSDWQLKSEISQVRNPGANADTFQFQLNKGQYIQGQYHSVTDGVVEPIGIINSFSKNDQNGTQTLEFTFGSFNETLSWGFWLVDDDKFASIGVAKSKLYDGWKDEKYGGMVYGKPFGQALCKNRNCQRQSVDVAVNGIRSSYGQVFDEYNSNAGWVGPLPTGNIQTYIADFPIRFLDPLSTYTGASISANTYFLKDAQYISLMSTQGLVVPENSSIFNYQINNWPFINETETLKLEFKFQSRSQGSELSTGSPATAGIPTKIKTVAGTLDIFQVEIAQNQTFTFVSGARLDTTMNFKPLFFKTSVVNDYVKLEIEFPSFKEFASVLFWLNDNYTPADALEDDEDVSGGIGTTETWKCLTVCESCEVGVKGVYFNGVAGRYQCIELTN